MTFFIILISLIPLLILALFIKYKISLHTKINNPTNDEPIDSNQLYIKDLNGYFDKNIPKSQYLFINSKIELEKSSMDYEYIKYFNSLLNGIQKFYGLLKCDYIGENEKDYFEYYIKNQLNDVIYSIENDGILSDLENRKQHVSFNNEHLGIISSWSEEKLQKETENNLISAKQNKAFYSKFKNLLYKLIPICSNLDCFNLQIIKAQCKDIDEILQTYSLHFYFYEDDALKNYPEIKNIFCQAIINEFELPIICIKSESNLEIYGNFQGRYIVKSLYSIGETEEL